MHASSFENMGVCYRRFIGSDWLDAVDEASVLDIGGADVNGSYRSIFESPKLKYIAADLAAAKGVSIVLDDPYKLPFDDSSIDIVLSGQMLEHCEFFWLAFAEMVRILKPTGYIFLIAPSGGPIHRYPVDCYRFYPDAYRALAKYAECRLIDTWLDDRGPWNDLVGVFQRSDAPERSANRRFPLAPAKTETSDFQSAPEEEIVGGSVPHLDVLSDIHSWLAPPPTWKLGFGMEEAWRWRNATRLASTRLPSFATNRRRRRELRR